MATAMGALLLVYGAWQILHWPAAHRTLVGDLFFYPEGLAAVAAAVCASRRCKEQRALRVAWRLLALAALAYLLGDVGQTVYEVTGHKPFPSIGDVFYLSFYPLMLWGLLRFPSMRSGNRQTRTMIDLAVVAISGALVVMYVVLGPTIVSSGSNALQNAVSIAYPVGDMVLLVGLASVCCDAPRRRRAGHCSSWPPVCSSSSQRISFTATSRFTPPTRAAIRSTPCG